MKKNQYFISFIFCFLFQCTGRFRNRCFQRRKNTDSLCENWSRKKESVGAISDEKGIFSIDLSKANTSHKVKIDVAGYEKFFPRY
ncbi:hypothetical protein ACFP3I_25205 [Chryseobacterium arachidis]|uniref:hypothetical protein n=1 Tax=Chryseobacterium arachidis TaxID=1416778 RepID=UPI00361E03A2